MQIMPLTRTALFNIQYLCPSLSIILTNCYRHDVDLYVDSQTLLSSEGTTQGDVLAMPMYSLATVPLIEKLSNIDGIRQTWYADDASATGSIQQLRQWWDTLRNIGPAFRYHINSCKSWLVVKGDGLTTAESIFGDSGIIMTLVSQLVYP